MKAILVDDEPSARALLRHKLRRCDPEIDILAECESVEEALSALDRRPPDVLFLDIEMPGATGFELLQQLGADAPFQVIFTTAHSEYAIEALRGGAFDYLLKPVQEDELARALDRLHQKRTGAARADAGGPSAPQGMAALLKSLQSLQEKDKKLAVPTSEGVLFLPLADIIRAEAAGSYATIFLQNRQKLVASKNLTELEEMLGSSDFFKVHKSHLVNLRYVTKYIRGEGGILVLTDGTEVDVSRRKKEELLARLSVR
ncbi:MAG: response regulator transcription factor [Saprospirales bacterium]|jgi:two-component system LytT family response regulator|nr:response regulator transcription factor [Saprospirales bacterium]MBK8922061.1 response regulator transcription factor [Saprospirales bacterium]